MSRTLILSTATQNIMGWIEIFNSSLEKHNPKKNYDLVILTFPGAFTDEGKTYLRKKGISIFEDWMDVLDVKKFSADFAEDHLVYRLKHLGKAYLVRTYLNRIDLSTYDFVIVSDLDILFQSSIDGLLDGIDSEKVHVAEEVRPLCDFPFLIRKLERAHDIEDYTDISFDHNRHEINYGFLYGNTKTVRDFFDTFLHFMLDPKLRVLLDGESGDQHGYHEQDFLRLFLQVCGYDVVRLLTSKLLIHLGSRGQEHDLTRLRPVATENKGNYFLPAVVHFAGGVWDMFPEIKAFLNCYYFPDSCPNFRDYFGDLVIGFDENGHCSKISHTAGSNTKCGIREAVYLQTLGHPEKAAGIFAEIYEKNGNRLDVACLLGISLIEARKFEQGLRFLKDMSDRTPEWVEMRIHVASLLEKMGEKKLALRIFDETRATAPHRADWLLPSIRLLVDLGCKEKASKLLDDFRQKSKVTLDIFREGFCLKTLGEHDEALAVYCQALQKWPSWNDLKVRIGFTLKDLGNLRDASRVFNEVIKDDPLRIDLRIHQIDLLMRLGHREEVQFAFGQLEKLRNEGLDPCQEGVCLKILGRHEEALRKFHEALSQRPDVAETKRQIGYCLKSLYRYEEALENFDEVLQEQPYRVDLKIQRIELLAKLGHNQEASEAFSQLQKDEGRVFDDYQQGLCLKLLGRFDEALDKFRQSLVKNGESVDLYIQMGDILRSMGQFEDSLHSLQHAIELNPSRTENKYMIISLLAKLGRFEEGNEVLLEIEKKNDRELLENPYQYGKYLKLLKRYHKAIEIFDKVEEGDPNFTDSQYQKGGALAALGCYKEAMECFQRVVTSCPERFDAKLSISDVHKYMKRYSEALELLDEVSKVNPAHENLDRKRQALLELMNNPVGSPP